MKVVALISGGKDSCYNMMQCVSAGHVIVALANLQPVRNTDELDSYMYQTVGHQAIGLYAEAMGLPLYRRTIEGSSLEIGRDYSPTEGDEVEDLYHLLKEVKEKEDVEAVSVGAILSDYQRVRVENVCARLQLQPLAYLWRRAQASLLSEMISCDLQAVLIKVAAFGLDPQEHLGKSLAQMEPYLQQLSRKYGVNVCGEGGEYETFTTDCPLFKKKIVIDAMETVIHSADAFAPVGYLRFPQMHTEDKPCGPAERAWPLSGCPCRSAIDKMTEEAGCADKTEVIQEEFASDSDLSCQQGCELLPCRSARSSTGYEWIAGLSGPLRRQPDVQGQTQQAFTALQGQLERGGWQLKHIVLVHLYVRDMQDFGEVNSVYRTFFKQNPPARVCVQAPLPAGRLLQMDCLLHAGTEQADAGDAPRPRHTLHVQSLSHWAPANIGPYSQAVRVDEAVFCAGQIALVPCTMQLLRDGPAAEARLSFSHTGKVLEAMGAQLTLSHALQAHCYVTSLQHVPAATAAWNHALQKNRTQEDPYGESEAPPPPLVVAVVPALPRGAAAELHVIAVHDDPGERTSCHVTKKLPAGTIECQSLHSAGGRHATLSVRLAPPPTAPAPDGPGAEGVSRALADAFREALRTMPPPLAPLCCRVFYKHSSASARDASAGFADCLQSVLGGKSPAVALVPVLDLPDGCLLHASCWLSV